MVNQPKGKIDEKPKKNLTNQPKGKTNHKFQFLFYQSIEKIHQNSKAQNLEKIANLKPKAPNNAPKKKTIINKFWSYKIKLLLCFAIKLLIVTSLVWWMQ